MVVLMVGLLGFSYNGRENKLACFSKFSLMSIRYNLWLLFSISPTYDFIRSKISHLLFDYNEIML